MRSGKEYLKGCSSPMIPAGNAENASTREPAMIGIIRKRHEQLRDNLNHQNQITNLEVVVNEEKTSTQ
jgi:hypothetical protein